MDITEFWTHDSTWNYTDTVLSLSGVSFKNSGLGQVIFNEGEYNYTVTIGEREYKTRCFAGMVWTAENLDWQFDVNYSGTVRPLDIGTDASYTVPHAYYYLNNQNSYGIDGTYKCGLLYNGYAVTYLNDNRNSLIPGWHVPSSSEWQFMMNKIGGYQEGITLKAKAYSITSNWPSSGWGGNDTYGFNVLPAGYHTGTSFYSFGDDTSFWTYTASTSNSADIYNFKSNFSRYNKFNDPKTNGFPIRLIKDA